MSRIVLRYLFLLLPFLLASQVAINKGKWQVVEEIGSAIERHENGFVCLDHKFYLIGGRGLKPISIYDVEKNSWSTGSPPPFEIHHFQAVAHNGSIYIIGAMTGKYPYETPISNILIYNPKTDVWLEGAEIPVNRRRGSAGVVIHNDVAFIVSGIVDGHNGTHVPWLDSYNFNTKKWIILEDAPRPRDHFHAVLYKGEIYASGGRNSSYSTNQTFNLTIAEIDVYSIKNDIWRTLPKKANLKVERAGASAITFKNYVVLIGGESVVQRIAHNEVEALDLQTNEWLNLEALQTGRHGTQALLYKDRIYIVAGSGNRGGRPELNTMEVFSFSE